MSSIVGKRYALANLDTSDAKVRKEKLKDLLLVKDTLLSSRQLVLTLVSPVIKAQKKLLILKKIFEKKVSDTTLRLLTMMIEKGRGGAILPMIEEFQMLVDREEGILNAYAVSYLPMNDSVQGKLKTSLEAMYSKKVRLYVDVDPSLIGGFKVKVYDSVIDASLAFKIKALKSYLEANSI